MSRKVLRCPICKKSFTQSRHNQKYCGSGCADTAKTLSNLRSRVNKIVGMVIDNE